MASFAAADLATAAGVDPWALLEKLHQGDPSEIEGLAAAFYRAGGDTAHAHASATKSHQYVTAGYVVTGGPALDYSAEVSTAQHLQGASEHLNGIARLLSSVGTHLAQATRTSASEVGTLDSTIRSIQGEYLTFWQGIGHHLPPDESASITQGYVDRAVAAVKHTGASVNHQITAYESTLASSLRQLADLGYLPADAVDEGPGDVDVNAADGTHDATVTIAAIDDKDRAAGVRQYDASTTTVDLLNRTMKANGRLDDNQYAYLYNYNQTLAPHLPQVDRWLHDPATQAAVTSVDGLSQSAPDQHQGAAALKQRGSILADGVLNLTAAAEQPTDHGAGPNDYGPGGEHLGRSIPPALATYLTMQLGEQVPNDPNLAHDPQHPGTTLRATWDPQNHKWVIANLDTTSGFSDLLANYSHQDVQGGAQFSKQLGEAGIHWKQQLNTIHDNTKAYYEAELEHANGDSSANGEAMSMARQAMRMGDPELAATYAKGVWPKDMPFTFSWNEGDFPGGDTVASDALSVTAHNPTGAADLLLDPTDRRAVMGLNWQDGHGAAQTLVSGTVPSTNPGAHTNAAAQAVMQDGATDYRSLSKVAAPEIKDALTTIAVDHIDSFGSPSAAGDVHGATRDITLPDGTVIHAVNLDPTVGENYLKLVSSFGDQPYSLVQQAALERGSQYVANAQHAGLDQGSAGYAQAWRMASELDGHVAGAGQAQLYDQYRGDNNDTVQKLVAAHEAYRNELGQYNSASNGLKWLTSAVALGSNIAGVAPPLMEFKVPLDFARTGLGMIQNTMSAPSNPLDAPPVFEDIYKSINAGATLDQNTLQSMSERGDAQHWMALRAQQLATGSDAAITVPNGYSGQSLPHGVAPLSAAQAVQLEHQMFPTYSGALDPHDAGNDAFNAWAGNAETPATWTTGTGAADPVYPWAPGGSWSNGDSTWQIHYGGNQRLTWDWGYHDSQVGPRADGDPYTHVLVGTEGTDLDPTTGVPSVDSGAKKSQWDDSR